jgi:preprotein translocase subunit SecG
MYILLVVIAIIVCVLLGIIVLVQNPKGGGLSSNFASSSQLMGVQRTGDFLEKGTWILAITLMVISLVMTKVSRISGGDDEKTQINKIINNSKPQNNGAAPTTTPFPGASTAQPGTPAPATPAPKKN